MYILCIYIYTHRSISMITHYNRMVGPRCVKEGLISQKICTEMRLIPLIPSIPVAAVNLVQLPSGKLT